MACTIMDVMEATAARFAHKPALKAKQNGHWKTTTWKEYRDLVRQTARAFMSLGLKCGEAISIIGFNRPEWFISNLGAIYAGGVPTGLYTTSSAEQMRYIVAHNESRLIVVEDDSQLAKLKKVWGELPKLRAAILMSGEDDDERVHSWSELQVMAGNTADSELVKRIEAQKPEDLCTLIYTSGTTGSPKGVMLSHDNLTWTADQATTMACFTSDDRLISYLPLSHIAEQTVSLHAPLHSGACSWFAESIEKLPENLLEVRPTLFIAVPRVWEKIQSKIMAAGAESSGLKKKVALWAKRQGLAAGLAEQEGKLRPLSYTIANALVFRTVRQKLGLEEARIVATTAAPIARDTLDFFLSLGIPLMEIYGMSECTGPATMSLPGQYRTGAAGPPLLDTEIKITDNGEVCLRGRHVFMGYYKEVEQTKEAIDEEGWLHTGDVGSLDDRGFLTITDRIKELIITAGGENIAPQAIEALLKSIPVIGQAVVVGDRRKYLTALLTLDPDNLPVEAKRAESRATDIPSALECDRFRSYLDAQIQSVNKKLSRVQTIKRYDILPHDFTVEGGELTHTMKLKRRVILEKYAELIETLYLEREAA